MNEHTLERGARALATGQSRRIVMKAAVGAVAGGALTMVGRHEEAAAGKRLRRCCRRKKRADIQFCAENGQTLVSFFCTKASTGPDFCISDGDCG